MKIVLSYLYFPGLAWLLSAISVDFSKLAARVEHDVAIQVTLHPFYIEFELKVRGTL